jgi:beta-galactosidase
VYSPSIWAGWYSGRYTEYKKSAQKEMMKVNCAFHAEWGGDSHSMRHSEDPDKGLAAISTGQGTDERGLAYLLTGGQARASKDGDWSESYICNLFDWHLKEQETMDWLTGSAAHESERARAARPHAQGRLLRLPVVLVAKANGAHLRSHVADPLGSAG